MFYRQLRKSVHDTKSVFIPADDPVSKHVKLGVPFQDYYLSVYKFNEQQKDQFLKTNSVKGIDDVVTDKLVFDFDSEDVQKAKDDAYAICERLIENGIEEENLQIYYSGRKGFHVVVDIDQDLNPTQHKAIAKQLANGLATFDTKVYDHARPFRALGSVNLKSGLYKIDLTVEEFLNLSVEQIKEKAKRYVPRQHNYGRSSLPAQLTKLKEYATDYKPEVKLIDTSELTMENKPKFLTNCRFALQNGHFEGGQRNTALLVLGATYKNLGFEEEHTYRLLKAVAEKQSKRTGQPKYDNEEIWSTIIKVVYSNGWKGGQFSCRQPGNWLFDYCQSLGDHKCDHKEENEDFVPKKLSDIHASFKDYVVNIEKNTIKTGIPSLDEKIFLSTGCNVGIIGAPGCHAKDTEILMYDGTVKKVQDVAVGDLLMGPDSTPRTVLQLRRGREKMVKINPLRSDSFVVNMNHILHLTPSKLKQKGKIPGNLNITVANYIEGTNKKQATLLHGYKLVKTGVEFETKYLEIDPYILGLWLGDGHSHAPVLTTMDKEIMDHWLEFAEQNQLKVAKHKAGGKAASYALSGEVRGVNMLREFLKKNNLINNKHIPQNYLLSSRKDRLKLLAGLIDTDGYKEPNGKGWEISSKFESLAKQIVFLARSLGFHASINKRKKSCTHKGKKIWGDYFIVYISGKNCEEVPVRLERKKVTAPTSTNPLLQGFTYEVLEEDDYYGFTLDKDHLYLTSDFFIHHNSGKTSIALDIVNNTSKLGVRSVLASLDMHSNRLFEKALYRVSGYTREALYQVFKENREAELMKKLEEEFGNVNFFHKSCPTVTDIRNYIVACNEQDPNNKVKLVLLDYFERVTSDLSDDTAASKRVAGELQDLVNDLDICLVTLVQPNKMSLSGGPDNPILSYTNIKGSSYVYQAFRIIFSLWRPFYNPKDFSNDKYMQMAILKNDLGELSELEFKWDGKRGKITEMEDHERYEFQELLSKKELEKKNTGGDNSW